MGIGVVMNSVDVRFGSTRGIVVPLEVSGVGGSIGVLQRILFALRVQVLSIEEWVAGAQMGHVLSLCEFDGGKLTPRRQRAIVAEVVAALAPHAQHHVAAGPHPGLASTAPANEKSTRVAA